MTARPLRPEPEPEPERRARFNPGELTLDELETAEAMIGAPIDKWDESPSRARVIRTVAYFALRRDNADTTIEDVGALTIAELEALIDLGMSADPTDPTPPAAE